MNTPLVLEELARHALEGDHDALESLVRALQGDIYANALEPRGRRRRDPRNDDVPLPDETQGIDFEGEVGVVVDDVAMACPPSLALRHLVLLVQINDVSLRSLAPREMRTGFGLFQSKPTSSFAPVAVTPDELGDAWHDARPHLDLKIEYNGQWFGDLNAGEMHFGVDQLVAHAAATRRLTAGTIIGSGTVSNHGGEKGSACIAERRAIETIEHGAPRTAFLKFAARVRMEARWRDAPVFGAIDQRVVQAPRRSDRQAPLGTSEDFHFKGENP